MSRLLNRVLGGGNISLESKLQEYSEEGLLEKIFPSIKKNRENRQKQYEEITAQREKDRDVFRSFVEGVESTRESKHIKAEPYRDDSSSHGIYMWDKKDNLMISIVSLKSFGSRNINAVEVKSHNKLRGVSTLDPWIDLPFGSIEVATTSKLDFDDYQVGDYFTSGFHTFGNTDVGEYLIFVVALDDPSLDRAHDTCSVIAYTASSFGEKTFKEAITKVTDDRAKVLSSRKYLSMIVN